MLETFGSETWSQDLDHISRKLRLSVQHPLVSEIGRTRFPAVEPVGPRVSRFGFFVGPFSAPRYAFEHVATTDYEAVPDIARDDARRVGTLVMKFGGTSVGNPERLLNVARRIVAAKEEGGRVVAVLSAMGDTTDELVDLAHRISDRPKPRAMDMLISVGERISCALAEMAIEDLGHQAVSLTGSQAGIVTDTTHTKAKIVEVRAQRIHAALDEGKIVLVAGFQGVSHRPGDHDPRPGRLRHDRGRARRRPRGRELPDLHRRRGRLHRRPAARLRRAEAARPHLRGDARDVRLRGKGDGATLSRVRAQPRRQPARALDLQRVAGNLDPGGGRAVAGEGDHLGCHPRHLRGEADDHRRARSPGRRGTRLPRARRCGREHRHDRPERLSRRLTDISFTLPKSDLAVAEPILESACKDVEAAGWTHDSDIAKVSLIGAGMRSHPGVAADMFEALAEARINIEIISTSSIRISCVVRAEDVERAVQAVHDKFQLVVTERANA